MSTNENSSNSQPGVLGAISQALEDPAAALQSTVAQVVDKVQRAPAKERKAAQPSDVVFGLERDYAIDADKKTVTRLDGGSDVNRWQAGRLVAKSVVGTPIVRIPFEKNRYLDIHRGAGVILGAADTGKSLLSSYIESQAPAVVELISYREPVDEAIWVEEALIARIVAAITSGKQVIIIDSLRTFFYEASGATGKGGVNMGIFKPLTVYDQLARQMGVALLFALNPMTDDADALQFYLGATSGAVSMSIATPKPRELKVSSRWAKNRDFMNLEYEPKKIVVPPQAAPVTSVRATSNDVESIADLWQFN